LEVENKGIQMLIRRMQTHPEEFSLYINQSRNDKNRRWEWIINEVLHKEPHTSSLRFLSEADFLILRDRLLAAQGEAFTSYIMSELLRDDKKDSGK